MRMVGPEYWLFCELERSWSGFLVGDAFLDCDFGGGNFGACESAEAIELVEAARRCDAEVDMLRCRAWCPEQWAAKGVQDM